ncbi:hypothetical protein KWF73_18350 [Acinetobacter pittii]|uniref:DUF6012 family protein n=1 Tax=Acinetobacter pittii TaxID=48296 RepID=UPI00355C2628
MLFHIVPKIYNPYSNITVLGIESIAIPDLNIHIDADQLSFGKPYPNKNYFVGMKKEGRKALNGLLLDLPSLNLKSFSVEIVWNLSLEKKTISLKHTILNTIDSEDVEDGLLTHDALFWYGYKNFSSKWALPHINQAPIDFEPCLNLEKNGLVNLIEEISLPVLERERLSVYDRNRTPQVASNKINFN